MAKKLACPKCESNNLKPWVLGRLKCGNCSSVYYKSDLEPVEYIPRRRHRRTPRRVSNKQERRTAKEVRGELVKASGATDHDKGDVKAEDIRVECKTTSKKSYRLQSEDLRKHTAQTDIEQIPAFLIEFRDDEGRRPSEEYYVVPKTWFAALLEAYRRDQNDS